MRIDRIECFSVAIPFRFAFRHSLAVRKKSESLVVRARDRDGNAGFGESAPRSYVTGETVDGAAQVVRDRFMPVFRGREFDGFESVVAALNSAGSGLAREESAAFCAFELAMLDLAGRAFDRCAGDVLGPVVDFKPEYSGVVSSDNPGAVARICETLVELGIRDVKVKLGRPDGTDREVLRIARDVLGPKRSLRGDANGAWSAKEALAQIESFAVFGLDAIEQPVPAEDIEGLAWLTARSAVPIVVDESLASFADAERLIRRRACSAFNLRVSKCGGLLNTARIRDLARDSGIGCILGAHVGETAILTAAGRQVASRCEGLLYREGSYGTLLLERDIGVQDVTFGGGGVAPALTGPGLGIVIDRERFRELSAPCPQGTAVGAGS